MNPHIRYAAGAAAVALVAAGGTAAASHKTVTLSIDGTKTSVSTFAGDVEGVLAAQDIEITTHDAVSPSLEEDIDGGDTIVVRYGRPLEVTLDGRTRTYWTTATTLGAALDHIGMREDAVLDGASRSQALGREGLSVVMATPKDVSLAVGGKKATTESTLAITVGDLLDELTVGYDKDDRISPSSTTTLTDGMKITVDFVEKKTVTRTESIPFQTRTVEDSSLYTDQSRTRTNGVNGSEKLTVDEVWVNGELEKSTTVKSTTVSEPVTRVVVKGTKARPAPSRPSAGNTSGAGLNLANEAMWDRIAQCESGGRWNINTGNGYYGGLQFNYATWLSVGGADFAPRADLATRAEQITVANRLYAQRGLQPWGCAHAA